MESFATDRDRLAFLLETDAALDLDFQALEALAGEQPAEISPEERPKYITNYIGSKQKLVEWIWKHTPDAVESVLDAFSGSAVVAYMYKTKGLLVLANDRLRYCFHAARAIIENSKTNLSDADVDALLAENPKAGTFVADNFKGIFFAKGVHELIDNIRANIDAFSGYKKDIALFALGKTCMSGKGGFGHFSSSTRYGKREDTPTEFTDRFRGNIARINALVFDNGKECKAFRKETNEILPEVKVDLAYFDPPYATEFSTTNYEKSYHFIEGLMSYWDGLTLNLDSKVKFYETDHQTVTQANARGFFEGFLGAAKHIPNWLISYRDHAYPNEHDMKEIIGALGRDTSMRSHEHKYSITAKHGEASNAVEHLFICQKAKAEVTGAADAEVDLRVADNLQALSDAPLGDALDLLTCQAGTLEPVRVTGYMGSKYLMLGWIERHIPKGTGSILDAFSGGANVGYHFKRKGFQVFSNDLLRYSYHLARAVIENSTEKLTEADVERILAPNADAGSFIVDNFHGYYYTKPVLRWLDQVWANIQKLPGYKKDLALAALGSTVKAKSAFGQFSRSKMGRQSDLEADASLSESQFTNIPLHRFIEGYKRIVAQLNALVFDNGKECKVFNLEAVEAVKRLGADVLYLDPPYVTEFGSNDYEESLHFVEGLMTRWADKELLQNNRRSYTSRTKYTRDSMKDLMDNLVSESRTRYGTVLLSYRDRAYPDEEGIKGILGEHFGHVRMHGMEVDYIISKNVTHEGGGGHARELLFVASKPRSNPRSQAEMKAAASLCHTSFPVEVCPCSLQQLSTEALDISKTATDPQFSFILCRAGTNKNGDNFTPDELAARYMTAVNKKIDLKHSQDLTDIVGGIVNSDYIEDETGGRIECIGELYTADSQTAQLAYKLIKRGIISQVSMECDYEEGECSICGKRFSNKNDYCIHLKKYKGLEFQGQPVFEILHGVTFSGLGLLDRKGADENARILQVGSLEEHNNLSQGAATMDQEAQEREALEAAKKKDTGGGGGAPADPAVRAKELEKENASLKQQVLEQQKQIDELLAEKKAAANRTRAQKLLKSAEKKGMSFGSDEDRERELNRLATLSDEAFSATETAWEHVTPPETKVEKKVEEPTPTGKEAVKVAETETPLKTDAGLRPLVVDDKKTSLEDKLKLGFNAAYRHRRAQSTGQPETTK